MRYFSTRCLLFLAVLLSWLGDTPGLRAQILDPAFQPTILKAPLSSPIQSGVNALVVQPDGKVVIAGGFDFVNGAMTGKLQRLNADGTTDATFNAGGTGANGFISALLLQPDGKIVVGGGFTTFNGQALPLVVRLNANGTLDTGFSFATAGSTRQISSLALQPDGKILVGSGSSFDGPQTGGLVRLLPSGAVDPSFNIGTGSTQGGIIAAVLVQADGDILVAGSFTDFNGQPLRFLVRLTSSGAFDPTFAFNGATANATLVGSCSALAQQSNGQLLVAGSFSQNSGQTVQRVVRLLIDGTVDGAFQPGTAINGAVRSLAPDASGNVLIGGAFTQVGGVARNRVARLTTTGALDTSYGDPAGTSGTVNAVVPVAGGQVLVGGSFPQYGPAANSAGLVRLNAGTGALDNQFAPQIEARGTLFQVVPLASGQLLVAGNFTQFNGAIAPGTATSVRRVNANGSLDQTFSVPATVTGNIRAVQPNGSFYVGLTRVLASGAVDNSFLAQPFGPTTGINAAQISGLVGQPNGQVLVFGRFTSYGTVTGLGGIIRLNADGTPDNTFVSASSSGTRRITQVLVQPSGKLLLLGDEYATPLVTVLTRLNANGSADNTFSVGTAAGAGANYSVLLQPDGRLLVSGGFTSFNGQAAPFGLTRLTVDGAADPTYTGVADTYSPRIVQSDGRLLASIGSRAPATLVRLNPNGSLDTSFSPVATPQSIFIGDDVLTGVTVQPTDGKILLFGSFRYVAGQVRIGLARLTNVGLATRAAVAVQPLGLYPNPARAAITIELPAALAARPAALLDLSGRVVRRWTVPARQASAALPLDAVPAGLYLLQVRGEDALYQQKLVVTP